MGGFLGDVLVFLIQAVGGLVSLYSYVIIAAVVISWVQADPYNPIVRLIRQLTEPAMAPARRQLWPLTRRIGVDLSPILVLLVLGVIRIGLDHLSFAVRRSLT